MNKERIKLLLELISEYSKIKWSIGEDEGWDLAIQKIISDLKERLEKESNF